MLFGKKNYSSLRQAQCLPLVHQGFWNEKWEADGGNQGNAPSENWERSGSRLPWGYLLWKDGLWAQMKRWLKSDRLVNNQSLGPSVRWLCQGADVRVRTLKVWGEHVTCWQCAGRQYFAHTSMLPVGGHWVTKPSSQMLLSVEGSVYSLFTCRLRTKWELHKTDRTEKTSNRTQFQQPPSISTGCIMLSTPTHKIDIFLTFLYESLIDLLLSLGFHFCSNAKANEGKDVLFTNIIFIMVLGCFYIWEYSCVFWFFSGHRGQV